MQKTVTQIISSALWSFLILFVFGCSAEERRQKRVAPASETESSDASKQSSKKNKDDKKAVGEKLGQVEGEVTPIDLGSPEFEVPLRKASRSTLKNSVEDVFGVGVDDFPEDRWFGLILENGAKNPIDKDMIVKLLAAAEKAAEQASPGLTASIRNQCQNLACIKAELKEITEKAYRRSISLDEATVKFKDFTDMESLKEANISAFIISTLLSPSFVFVDEVTGDDKLLNNEQIAFKLSRLLWQSIPDTELMSLAKLGKLSNAATRVAQAERLLKSAKAKPAFIDSVKAWHRINDDAIYLKANTIKDQFSETQISSLSASLENTILNSFTSVDFTKGFYQSKDFEFDTHAAVFFGDNENDQTRIERKGFLMHPLTVASHSAAQGPFPFPWGEYILENVLCRKAPGAPENLADLIAARQEEIAGEAEKAASFRKGIELLTAAPGCQGCHAILNPPGFAFLSVDPIGKLMATESNGAPIDTSGEFVIDGQKTAFKDTASFIDIIANSAEAKRCFATVYFRKSKGVEGRLPSSINDNIAAAASFQDIIKIIVADESFITVEHE